MSRRDGYSRVDLVSAEDGDSDANANGTVSTLWQCGQRTRWPRISSLTWSDFRQSKFGQINVIRTGQALSFFGTVIGSSGSSPRTTTSVTTYFDSCLWSGRWNMMSSMMFSRMLRSARAPVSRS